MCKLKMASILNSVSINLSMNRIVAYLKTKYKENLKITKKVVRLGIFRVESWASS